MVINWVRINRILKLCTKLQGFQFVQLILQNCPNDFTKSLCIRLVVEFKRHKQTFSLLMRAWLCHHHKFSNVQLEESLLQPKRWNIVTPLSFFITIFIIIIIKTGFKFNSLQYKLFFYIITLSHH